MQVFVARAELTGAADEIVIVRGSYDDNVVISTNAHGDGMIILSVLPTAILREGAAGDPAAAGQVWPQPPRLVTDWRESSKTQIVGGEANRRIVDVFPDYSQRNSNSEMNSYITQYGTDSATWPAGAQSRKAEIDRCWTYVNAVRDNANAMTATTLPVDPTGDGNWPTRVPPYVPA
jgi:hypothetical protein